MGELSEPSRRPAPVIETAAPEPQPAERRREVSRTVRVLSWALVPLLFVVMTTLRALHLRQSYGAPALMLACNLVLLAGLAGLVSALLARSFLARGELGLLLLCVGAEVWALTALTSGASALVSANLAVTIHNTGALLAGGCHAFAAATLQGRPLILARRTAAMAAAGVAALAAVGLLAALARAGALPVYFVEGAGGTPVRQGVLGAATAAFALSAAGLARGSSRSGFRHWYALGLGLTTVGLYGVLEQETFGGLLGWLGRGGQYLGGLAMLAATITSVRESQAWAVPLGALLRQTEARYRSLFENMSEGLVLAEPSGAGSRRTMVVADLNPAAEALTGAPRERAVGRPLRDLCPDGALELEEACAAAVHSGAPARLAVTGRDGRRHFQVVAFSPEAGRVAMLFSDDSDRRRYEHALLEANARLSEVDRNRGQFLALLSHELRNPLAPIRNALVTLDRCDPASDAARRSREILGRQVEQLTHLVDELLDLTRISSGKIRLDLARVDLGEMVRRAGEDRRDSFANRGLTFALELSDERLPASADPTRFVQILGNLLQNAAKFTPAGGTVTLSTARVGDVAEIRVRDTGVGIEPMLVARLFDPFVQGEATLGRTEGGLGLGLALVKGLVELHGGTIEARSEGPGHGTEMIVRLPLSAEAAAG